ncbi:MAG: hypothetical protein ACREP4_12190 [Stenotrophomonas sp.]|uniref:hypothetical protein n=1 Tax=Stenotrophomonas sp. TaxID=69392 RepID=UPI003D6D5967
MDTLHFFLEGPGRETIAVTPVDAQAFGLEQARADDAPRRMMDDDGNLADQTDKSGYRYQFRERFGVWSLIVSD